MLRDPAHRVLLSSASAWEIAIKHAAGKLPLPASTRTAWSSPDGEDEKREAVARVLRSSG